MSKAEGMKDVVYINGNVNEKCFVTHGITFKEFYQSLRNPLTNLLLLKHQFEDSDYHYSTHMDYLEEEQVSLLVDEEVSDYGDFCWIDVDDVSSLDLLEPQDIASLLYLGHMKKPLHSPFVNKLSNQFVYLAGEDGYYNKTYYRDVYDIKHMISRVIPLKASSLKQKGFGFRRKKSEYPALPLVVANTLLMLTQDGLLFDFEQQAQSRKDLHIPVYTIGRFTDMEDMYNERFNNQEESKLRAYLIFNKKEAEWTLEEV
ncbi:peptide ABC transporter permease [Priestia flexa]|uniref:peptide ABC transporter permease n=1 Tax=Priestia flexa TaxID=86664 RepID=UPI00099C3639|nr:peptide ABC transporter permease [Priestia flexa]